MKKTLAVLILIAMAGFAFYGGDFIEKILGKKTAQAAGCTDYERKLDIGLCNK